MYPTIGQRIRAARTYRGMGIRKLADLLGVTHAAVSYWENDRNGCGLQRLRQIAAALNVPLDYLTGERVMAAAVGRRYPGTWQGGRVAR